MPPLLVRSGVLSRGLTPQQAAFRDIALKGIGGLVAVAGAAVAAVKCLDEKARNTHDGLMEAQKPFPTERQEVSCERVSTSTLSTKAPGIPEHEGAESTFRHLYRGALPLVTDRDVGGAANRFEDIRVDDSMGAEATSVTLRDVTKDLAERCRSSPGFARHDRTRRRPRRRGRRCDDDLGSERDRHRADRRSVGGAIGR